jgi:acyl-CoA thioester hydrolase
MTIETPYQAYTTTVQPAWIDYNGHMNVGYYHVVFDIAVEPFFHWLGLTPEFREKTGGSTFALEAHLNYFREVREGDPLRFETRLLDHDEKRIHFYQEMFHAQEGFMAASHETISVWVDMNTRKTAPLPAEAIARLAEVKAAHSTLSRPWQIGHAISVKKPG